MLFLARFRPRLVGPVLSGTAGPHADIGLHLFADTPMDVLLFLMEHRIPLRYHGNTVSNWAMAIRSAYPPSGSTPTATVSTTVFAPLAEREAPRSQSMAARCGGRALAEVQAPLAEDRQRTPPAAPER